MNDDQTALPKTGGQQPEQGTAAEPRCPNCNSEGIQHITSRESIERSRTRQPWFLVIYCNVCGHVYNTVPKHVFTQATSPRFVLPKPD